MSDKREVVISDFRFRGEILFDGGTSWDVWIGGDWEPIDNGWLEYVLDAYLAMQDRLAEAEALLQKSRRGHLYCEDSWYSCPKAEDGCANESMGMDCTCGAEEWNAEIGSYFEKEKSG